MTSIFCEHVCFSFGYKPSCKMHWFFARRESEWYFFYPIYPSEKKDSRFFHQKHDLLKMFQKMLNLYKVGQQKQKKHWL